MIILKTPEEIAIMKEAGTIVSKTLTLLSKEVAPGVTTAHLDKIAEEFIRSEGAVPSFKDYNGFPSAACISVNEVVVHGFPGPRRLQEGDIVSLDIGAFYKGFHGDAARTFPVGTVSETAKNLIEVTKNSFYAGVEFARNGCRLEDISSAVQEYAESHGFSVVREFVGHGVGQNLHESPDVPNFGRKGRGIRLREGMVLAIEPMINVGTPRVKILEDGWTAVTLDGKLSAHYENTVAITEDGPMILTDHLL